MKKLDINKFRELVNEISTEDLCLIVNFIKGLNYDLLNPVELVVRAYLTGKAAGLKEATQILN